MAHNCLHSASHQASRILFIRSYSQSTFAAFIAGGLRRCQSMEFMQYPAWPSAGRKHLDKLYQPQQAWDDLHANLVTSRRECYEKLLSGYFDLVLLLDYDAQLSRYQWMGFRQKCNAWGMLWNTILRRRVDAFAHMAYMRALPLPLSAIDRITPVAAVDLSDWMCLTPANQRILQESSLYFKREVPYNRFFLYYQKRPSPWKLWRKKLLPLFERVNGIPLGIEDAKYADFVKLRVPSQDIDVFFAGGMTNTLRVTALQRLREWSSSSSRKIVVEESLPFDEYCKLTARSKITISIAGGGWDCFRHYEALALGSLPLMNKPTVDAIWWHTMPKELFFENTFSDFKERIETLLDDDALRQHCLKDAEQQIEGHMLHSKIVKHIVQNSLDKLNKEAQ